MAGNIFVILQATKSCPFQLKPFNFQNAVRTLAPMNTQLNVLKTLHSALITNTDHAEKKLLWIANKKK